MHRRAFLSLTGVAAAASRLRAAQTAAADDASRPSRRWSAAKMAEYRVPGVGLGLLHGDRLHVQGFGVTSLDDPRPVTADTLFTIASISKTMTATAVMKLIELGRLELHTPVHDVLPEFRVRDEAASAQVTPWHLLTHTPGWEGQLTTEDRGAEALAQFAATIMPTLPQLARPARRGATTTPASRSRDGSSKW